MKVRMGCGLEVQGRVALTGTPGTGKSTVLRLLSRHFPTASIAELHGHLKVLDRGGRGITNDPPAFKNSASRLPLKSRPIIVEGHLAHLLAVREVIVLRCHPRELIERLRKARRGTEAARHDNAVAEAIDLVLFEALRRHRRVWEVDTTGRTPQQVERRIRRLLRTRPGRCYGRIDWLKDPWVTEHLFRTSS